MRHCKLILPLLNCCLKLPTALHHAMFELAIRYLGDDEQVKQWLPLITKCKIIGNYSQTELGHGSNVRVSCDVKCNAVEDTNLI